MNWTRGGSWRLVEDVKGRDDLHPAYRPIPVGRVRGGGGGTWEVGAGRVGVCRAGETKSGVGVLSRTAEDQDVERRAQLGRWRVSWPEAV